MIVLRPQNRLDPGFKRPRRARRRWRWRERLCQDHLDVKNREGGGPAGRSPRRRGISVYNRHDMVSDTAAAVWSAGPLTCHIDRVPSRRYGPRVQQPTRIGA